MKWKIALLGALVCGRLFGGPLDDKTPSYFVDRYGPAKSSGLVSSVSVYKPKAGGVEVKGSFSVREFREDNLRVTATFFHPSLKIATVRLQLKGAWTAEQLEAALKAYGGQWKPNGTGLGINVWTAPDGTMAVNMLTWVEFLSKEAVDLADKTYAEAEAKRKAIPKF